MAAQREWFEKDYYKVLGVSDTASQKEITRAYRKLARQHHPDANPDNAAAEERFKEISAAYDVLGDEEKRKEYDEVRRLGPLGSPFGGGGAGGPGGFSFNVGGEGLGDLFGDLFRGRRSSTSGVGPRRGTDLEAELTMSFEDAVHGITTALVLTTDAVCSTCKGSGARPGTTPKVCRVCNGRGVIDDNQGLFSFSTPCTTCQGRGVTIDDPCPTCHGSGTERRPREVKVRIPQGVDDGQRIRLAGRGAPGRAGGPPGDLFVTVHVLPHDTFGREGRNLTTRVPISFPTAALGGEITVPTLDGDEVRLRVKPGTQPGSRQRVRGRGVTSGRHRGDLIVTFDVRVPTSLSGEQRKAIEQLASTLDGQAAGA